MTWITTRFISDWIMPDGPRSTGNNGNCMKSSESLMRRITPILGDILLALGVMVILVLVGYFAMPTFGG